MPQEIIPKITMPNNLYTIDLIQARERVSKAIVFHHYPMEFLSQFFRFYRYLLIRIFFMTLDDFFIFFSTVVIGPY